MAFRLPRFSRRPRRILRVLELRKQDSASERQAPDEKQCLPRCRAGLFSLRGKLLRGVKSARRACGGGKVHGQDRGQRVPSAPLFPRGRSLLSPRCVAGMRISRHSSSRPGRRPCFQAPKRPGTAFRVGQAARGRPSDDPSESAFKAIGRSNQAVSRATSHLESSGGSHSDRNFDRAAGGRESEGGGRSNGDGL
jgi:hypothetical protein